MAHAGVGRSTVAFRYDVVAHSRAGRERVHPYVSDSPLEPGEVIRLTGRDWLIEETEDSRAIAKPARYRVVLRHPDGREEVGAFRRWRTDVPRLGHSFTTYEDGQLVAWEVRDERLAFDDQGEPFLELVAERDYGELEGDVPDHQLEHAVAREEDELPEGARVTLSRADEAGLAVELVALEPGEAPDWEEAERYIDALTLDLLEDDLIELCGVDPDRDPRETWLDKVKERLRSDLERFRADVEGDHDEIEEWDYRDGRIFASVGTTDDEADPDKGHGWMCRLVDAGVLTVAGFRRVRKPEL
jgi:hypothetical protein